jgi:ABC-type Fe3+/spermidine/putrescine transport system ATPase subunit
LEKTGDRAIFELENGGKLAVPVEPSDTGIPTGKPVFLSIRPERIRLGRHDAETFIAKGIIKFVTYVGSLSTYLVEVMGQELKVQLQNDADARPFRQGEEVSLHWRAENQSILTE